MEIKQINSDKTSREYKVVLSSDKFESAILSKLKEIQSTITLQGFRKGKAPLNLVESRHGKQIIGDIINQKIQDSLKEIVDSNGYNLAMQPELSIASAERGKDLDFSFTMELYPEFELTDLSKVKLVKNEVEVTDEEVEKSLKEVASSHKDFESVKRKSKNGDQVVINYKGSIDGVAFEGGSADGHPLELGSGQFIPGFEEQLIG